jgi:hypothetical protein
MAPGMGRLVLRAETIRLLASGTAVSSDLLTPSCVPTCDTCTADPPCLVISALSQCLGSGCIICHTTGAPAGPA